jgi:hypothetical protein
MNRLHPGAPASLPACVLRDAILVPAGMPALPGFMGIMQCQWNWPLRSNSFRCSAIRTCCRNRFLHVVPDCTSKLLATHTGRRPVKVLPMNRLMDGTLMVHGLPLNVERWTLNVPAGSRARCTAVRRWTLPTNLPRSADLQSAGKTRGSWALCTDERPWTLPTNLPRSADLQSAGKTRGSWALCTDERPWTLPTNRWSSLVFEPNLEPNLARSRDSKNMNPSTSKPPRFIVLLRDRKAVGSPHKPVAFSR